MSDRDPLNFLKLLESPGTPKDYYLFRVDGREMLSTPFEFRLTIRARADVPVAQAWLGAPITFVMGPSDGVHRMINGQCIRFEHAYQKGAYTEFVLDVAPAFVSLRVNRDNRIFADKSVKEVIAKVLQERAISFDDSKVKSASAVRDYIVQYNESDFDFLNRLMEREGIFYYFLYDKSGGKLKHKMMMADDVTGFFDGKPMKIAFKRDYLLQGLQEFETSYSKVTGAWITHDYDDTQPRALSPVKTTSKLGWAEKTASVYQWPGGGPKPEGVQQHSKIGMEEAEAASMLIEGVGSYVTFQPGARHQVDDMRLVTRERNIAIRSVVHAAWDPWGLEEGEPSYHQQFSAVPSQAKFRPPSTTPPAIVRGPQTAVVLDQKDAKGLGRVKVRFHWDRHETSTCWIRVAQQWAGAQIGAQFIPRVGMEVLVDFLEGDPDRPLVIGSLYNGDNKPPFELTAHLSQAGWRTKSHPTGDTVNIFQFEDKAGSEEIYTFAGRNLRRETKNDEDVDITGFSKLHVGKDETSKIDGQVTIEVGKDSTTTTGGDFRVHARGAIELAGDGSGTVESLGQVTIKSSTGITLQVGGSTVSITPGGITISGPLVTIN